MTTAEKLESHGDRREWKSEQNQWRDELRVRQRELKDADASVEKLRQILNRHASSLGRHADILGVADYMGETHPKPLAQATFAPAPTGVSSVDEQPVDTFDHFRRRRLHEQLKLRHHKLVARLSMLMRSLELHP